MAETEEDEIDLSFDRSDGSTNFCVLFLSKDNLPEGLKDFVKNDLRYYVNVIPLEFNGENSQISIFETKGNAIQYIKSNFTRNKLVSYTHSIDNKTSSTDIKQTLLNRQILPKTPEQLNITSTKKAQRREKNKQKHHKNINDWRKKRRDRIRSKKRREKKIRDEFNPTIRMGTSSGINLPMWAFVLLGMLAGYLLIKLGYTIFKMGSDRKAEQERKSLILAKKYAKKMKKRLKRKMN